MNETSVGVPVIDAHFHAWRIARGDYGWLTPSLAPLYRDVTVEDWWREAQACGVQGGVLVQAAPTESETQFLLELAAHPRVLGVVGWVDWLAPDAPGRIAALARHPKLRALRPMLQDIPDPDWILQPALEPCLRAMTEQGLVLDALVKPVHLPRLRKLARRHPQLKVVIDHGAKPEIGSGQWAPWSDQIEALAQETAWDCKLSGLLTECGPHPTLDAARPWMQHLLQSFGAGRLIWGSDWPVVERAAGYGPWWRETHEWLAPLGGADRATVLGGNARRAYGLKA